MKKYIQEKKNAQVLNYYVIVCRCHSVFCLSIPICLNLFCYFPRLYLRSELICKPTSSRLKSVTSTAQRGCEGLKKTSSRSRKTIVAFETLIIFTSWLLHTLSFYEACEKQNSLCSTRLKRQLAHQNFLQSIPLKASP